MAGWLVEQGLGGKATLERMRRTEVRTNKERKHMQAKKSQRDTSKSAIHHVMESKNNLAASGEQTRVFKLDMIK